MRRDCAVCGEGFEAQTAKARFCSTTCRTRNHKNPRLAEVRAISTPAVPPPAPDSSVTARTLTRIASLELDEDPQAAVALVLARRLDSDAETGAAVASLARQYGAVMEDLNKRGRRKVDVVDEIAARMSAKAQGA